MSDKKSMPGYMWLLAGLILGLFVALLVYLQKQPADEISLKDAVIKELEKVKQNKSIQTPVEKNTQRKVKETTTPRFDFYKILPELEVLIPESEINSVINKIELRKDVNINSLKKSKKYILQVGSFRNMEDAEGLKASLGFLGLKSSVKTVEINQASWHRVRLGPYNNLNSLQETLSILKSNNINAMSMELKN